jgi:hypothetical protein
VHWKEGDHKKQCKALRAALGSVAAAVGASSSRTPTPSAPTSTNTATRSAASASRSTPTSAGAGVSEGGACIICLESDPPPIQSGCACRGDAGLAHVECRAEEAAHRVASSDTTEGWCLCGTCGQRFHWCHANGAGGDLVVQGAAPAQRERATHYRCAEPGRCTPRTRQIDTPKPRHFTARRLQLYRGCLVPNTHALVHGREPGQCNPSTRKVR